jgi:hypothetical protein
MSRSQARWFLALVCVVTLAGCAPATEPRSGGDTRSVQERERNNEPSGMRGGGGGGGY